VYFKCTNVVYLHAVYEMLLQESEHGAVELPKMLSDSQRMCKVIVELIETERQYVRVSAAFIHSVISYIQAHTR